MLTYGVVFSSLNPARMLAASKLGALALAATLWFVPAQKAQAVEGSEIDRDSFLRAIAEVETGGNSRAIGRRGERGMYQFSRATWRQHTSESFHAAHNPSVSRTIAIRHYEWLQDGFVRNGRTPTPYMMAAAWNAGLTRTLSGKIPSSSRDYARRVVNVASVYSPRTSPLNPPRMLLAAGE